MFTMRVAVFSDIQGNPIAFDAVLGDIDATGGVDAHWFVGDAVAKGYDPVGVMDRLVALPNLVAVRGNTDRNTVSAAWRDRAPTLDEAQADRDELLRLIGLVQSFAWTRGAITSAGHYDWLASLPLDTRVTLPDGTRVLLVHAAPGTDGGLGFYDGQSVPEMRTTLRGADADLLFVGHTHVPMDRTLDGVRVINLGSISNPVTDDKRAMWTLLDADGDGYRLERRFVEYDREQVIRNPAAVHPPIAEMIGGFFRISHT
jgi:predicted phosphodiesterase